MTLKMIRMINGNLPDELHFVINIFECILYRTYRHNFFNKFLSFVNRCTNNYDIMYKII